MKNWSNEQFYGEDRLIRHIRLNRHYGLNGLGLMGILGIIGIYRLNRHFIGLIGIL